MNKRIKKKKAKLILGDYYNYEQSVKINYYDANKIKSCVNYLYYERKADKKTIKKEIETMLYLCILPSEKQHILTKQELVYYGLL